MLVQLNGGAKQRDFKRLLTMRLQRVESSELIEFPENEEGYLGKIRWYSFQFLMQVGCLLEVNCHNQLMMCSICHAATLFASPGYPCRQTCG